MAKLIKTVGIVKVPAAPWIMQYVTFFDKIDKVSQKGESNYKSLIY
jgi:hypothetical protein